MKLWICFCIIALICSVYVLFEEEFKVVYQSEDDYTMREMSYLVCFDLKTTLPSYSSRERVKIADLNRDLLEYFGEMAKNYSGKPADFREMILNPLKSCESLLEYQRLKEMGQNYSGKPDFGDLILNTPKNCDYLLWNEDVCFNSRYIRNIFFEEERFEKQLTLFAFHWATFTVIKLSNNYYRNRYMRELNLLKVVHKPHPYSNCKDRLGNDSYTRFGCLNQCFKRGYRLSKYYFNFSERADRKKPIYLQYDSSNKSIAENENRCFELCKFEDCNLIYFVNPVGYIYIRSAYKAYPVISRFELWAQLAGLVTLICNVSFYQLLSAIYILVARKARQEKVKRLFFHLRIIALLFCVLYLSSAICYMVSGYLHKTENPAKRETTINLFKPEIIHLAVMFKCSFFYN